MNDIPSATDASAKSITMRRAISSAVQDASCSDASPVPSRTASASKQDTKLASHASSARRRAMGGSSSLSVSECWFSS